LQPFVWNHPGEPVPEENFWTLWCKGRLTEADTPTIRLGVTLSGLTSAHLHYPPAFSALTLLVGLQEGQFRFVKKYGGFLGLQTHQKRLVADHMRELTGNVPRMFLML